MGVCAVGRGGWRPLKPAQSVMRGGSSEPPSERLESQGWGVRDVMRGWREGDSRGENEIGVVRFGRGRESKLGMRPGGGGGHRGLKCEVPILRMGRMLLRGRDGLGGPPRGRGNGVVRVGDQACDPHLPHPTPTRAWGLPVPEGSLAAPAPRPALCQPLRPAASAPPRLCGGPRARV